MTSPTSRQRTLINACTQGTDGLQEVQFRCPECLGCVQCKEGQKLGLMSPIAIQEQQALTELVRFVPGKQNSPGHYISKLPLYKDHKSYILDNFDGASESNKKLLISLQKKQDDIEAIKKCYDDLIERGFVVALKNLSEEQQKNIKNKTMLFIPNSVAYKSSSHSTKIRICWDASRKTGAGVPLNAQLMRGAAVYSMTRTLICWRRGKFGLTCDVSKFYNRLHLDEDHYNLHLSVWRPGMNPNEKPQIYVLCRHFYGVASSAALLLVAMKDVANEADRQGLVNVGKTIRAGFVDDLSNSMDSNEEIHKLKENLQELLSSRGLPLKGFAITGSFPDKSLSPENHLLIGGWIWYPYTDITRLNVPLIFKGKKIKGRYKEGTTFLQSPQTKADIEAFYTDFKINLTHILSRSTALYDQTGSAAPLMGYGRWITRLALVESKGVFLLPVSKWIRDLFLDFLWQVFKFGQVEIIRNKGLAKDPRQATLVAYFDAGHEGEVYVLHLVYETEIRGLFHSEFLFAAHSLVPMGRNVPHSELDSGYRASRQVGIVREWLEDFITCKALIGDAQIALFWILNRNKRTTTFIRNRTHAISRTFRDEEIFYIKSKDNPADISTKFMGGFEEAYKKLGDGELFRTGPDFMKYGLDMAVINNNLTPIANLSFELKEKREANDQLTDTGDNGSQHDAITKAEMCYLVAIGEIPVEIVTNERLPKQGTDTEEILFCANEDENDEDEKDEEEKPMEAKVGERLEYSKYLVCPIRYSYRKMYDTTSLTFAVLYNWVERTFPKQTRTKTQNRILKNLDPETKNEESKGFMLERDEGNIEEEYYKAKLTLIGHELQELKRKGITEESPFLLWKSLCKELEERIKETGHEISTSDWLRQAEYKTKQLELLLESNKGKYEEEGQNKETFRVKDRRERNAREVSTLLAGKYDPLDDKRIKKWATYPGVSQLIHRCREIKALSEDIDIQMPQTISKMLKPSSTFHKCVQEILALTSKVEDSILAMASTQAGPIVVAVGLKALNKAGFVLQRAGGDKNEINKNRAKVLEKVDFVICNAKQAWPRRKLHNFSNIFRTVDMYKRWAKVTNNYLKAKASKECEHFMTNKMLKRVGILESDGIWYGRHRLYHVGKLDPQDDKQAPEDMGFCGDPYLLEKHSPLAWSIGIHVHYKSSATSLGWRPSSLYHRGWRTCHRDSLRYGILIGYRQIFRKLEETCIVCMRRKSNVSRVKGGPLHHTQLTKMGPNATFRYIMMDLTAPLRFVTEKGEKSYLYGLLSVCMVSKLSHIVPMEGKKVADFLLALNVLFGEIGVPEKLYVDKEGGLLKTHRNMIVEVNEGILRHHNIAIEQVCAYGHVGHGLVERKMRDWGIMMGKLDMRRSDISKVQASNYLRVISGKMNSTPYGLRFAANSSNPLETGQDLNMELLTPNHWKISHKKNGLDAAFIKLPGTLTEHEGEVQKQLETLVSFNKDVLLPQLLLDVDTKRLDNDKKLREGSVVIFWKTGDNDNLPKRTLPTLARVVKLFTDKDNDERKAEIKYSNEGQLKEIKGHLIGPSHTTIRRVDQLIPVDDKSQLFDVNKLITAARETAKMVTLQTAKHDTRTEHTDIDEKVNIERKKNKIDTENVDAWESKESRFDKEWEGTKHDKTPSSTHAMHTRSKGYLNTE